jgi:hypothetical protein
MITWLRACIRRRWAAPADVRPLWIVLGAGFGLRLYRLGFQSIWYDEGVSLYLARQTLSGLIRHTAADIHPPLYYLLLHFWIRVAGDSEFSAAFLSVICGLLLVAFVYRVSARLAGRRGGLVAAGLIALSPFNLWYSQEIRMYTLGALLGLVAIWHGSRCVIEPTVGVRGRGGHAGVFYVLAAAAGLYTLYYFAFLLIALNLWAAWRLVRGQAARGALARWLTAQVAVAALCVPWLPVAARQALNPPVPPWRSAAPLWSVLVQSWSALSFGQSMDPAAEWWALALTLALFGAGLWAMWRRRAGSALWLFCLLGPIALIVLLSFWTPLFHVRYVFTYSPVFYLILAMGLVAVWRRAPVVAYLAAMLWLGVSGYSVYQFHTSPLYAADDFRTAARDIADHAAPGDAVLINAGYAYPPFLYYDRDPLAWRGRLVDYPPPGGALPSGLIVLQTGSIGGSHNLGWGRPDADFYATDEQQTAQALARVFAAHSRLWVLRAYDTVVDPNGFIRNWLDEHGRQFQDRLYPGESYIRVQGYLTQREAQWEAPALDHPRQATFGGRLSLLGWTASAESARAGQSWNLDFYWQGRERMAADYRAVVELTDAQGRAWARDDQMLIGDAYPTSRWLEAEVVRQPVRLRAPSGIPAGLYTLQVFVYDSTKQEALGVVDAPGPSASSSVEAGRLSVVD